MGNDKIQLNRWSFSIKKEDDVAHIIMKGRRRMPTKEDAEELFSECSWKEETINGVVSGLRVTGLNNNSIFLPCNGQYDEGGLHWEDTEVYLWTSDCNDYYGYSLSNWGVYDQNHRHDGLCVRAVFQENDNNIADEYEYVDLGLPSGTLWATLNIGANNPEEYGQYFAWGELEEKTDYSTQAYLYYNGTYENIGTDIANTEYDVAKYLWGNEWNMPTYNQFQELMNNCSWTRTTQNNISGYIVQGSNNSSIFLPCGGFKNGSGDQYIGTMAYYWSSTSNGSTAYCVWDGPYWYCNYRRDGMPIRPVRNQ